MLYFSRWKATAILLTTLLVCAFAVPNFFPEKTVQSWPKWAQRHLVLGLDLQGGSHILLEVDTNAVRKEKVETLARRRAARGAREPARQPGGGDDPRRRGGIPHPRGRRSSSLRSPSCASCRSRSAALLSATGQRSVDVVDAGNGMIRLTPTEPAIIERIRQSVEQSIQIVERRVNELGTVEPSIQRQGVDRILVQVPGLQDPSRLKELLGKTAKLTFRLVDQTTPVDQALQGNVPPDSELLKSTKAENNQPYVIEKRVVVSGEDLTDAQPGFDQRNGEPIVSFRFNNNGARRFAQVTQENVGKPFAIVLDNEVISAPVIREPILGGSGQISGNFTVQAANDLAILLRAGALPAPLTIIEERTVGPGLGQDSIEKGKLSVLRRRGHGHHLHVRDLRPVRPVRQHRGRGQRRDDLRRAVAAQRNADAARHRRHRAHGRHRGRLQRADLRAHPRRGACRPQRRSWRSTRALPERSRRFMDSNITTFIAAAVLFYIGTGPVRGFAVTLGIGIITTVFTAFTLTRLIVAMWVRWWRPKTVPI